MTIVVKDPVDLSISHFIDAWRTMCEGAAGYAEEGVDSIHYVFSGLPHRLFQRRPRHRPERVGNGIERLRPAGVRVGVETRRSVALCDHPGVARCRHRCRRRPRRVRAGAAHAAHRHVRARRGSALARAAGAAVVTSTGRRCLRDASWMSTAWRTHGSRGGKGNHRHAVLLVGSFSRARARRRGTPASAAAVFMVGRYRYVALVATDPARQRRGYGDAVMRHALELSARVHGRGPTTLHATEAGRPDPTNGWVTRPSPRTPSSSRRNSWRPFIHIPGAVIITRSWRRAPAHLRAGPARGGW